jgi:hypothetical protein
VHAPSSSARRDARAASPSGALGSGGGWRAHLGALSSARWGALGAAGHGLPRGGGGDENSTILRRTAATAEPAARRGGGYQRSWAKTTGVSVREGQRASREQGEGKKRRFISVGNLHQRVDGEVVLTAGRSRAPLRPRRCCGGGLGELWRGTERREGVGRYLKGNGRCTVHPVRAPTWRRAAARGWSSRAVLLRACEAVLRFGGTRASRCATERRDATGRAACQAFDERTGRRGVAVQRRWGSGVDCGRVSEAWSVHVHAFDVFWVTRGGRWGGRRGRVGADVPAGHRGSPPRVRGRKGEESVQQLSGREKGCRGSCRTAGNCQEWRRERDPHDLMVVPEVVTKRGKREREVGCGAREHADCCSDSLWSCACVVVRRWGERSEQERGKRSWPAWPSSLVHQVWIFEQATYMSS